jgi:ubiquitin-conjugating enzyme E2 J2
MKATSSRLQRELQEVLKNLPSGVLGVSCAEGNLFEVHFVLQGPVDTAMEQGQYWGVFRFPSNYPVAPPALIFFTPSGRFEPGKKVCASFTDFHPESWQVSWRLSTLLIATLSFMVEYAPTAGSVNSFSFIRRELACKSWTFNAEQSQFRQLFPNLLNAKRGFVFTKEFKCVSFDFLLLGEELLKVYRASMQKQQLGLLAALMLLLIVVVIGRMMGYF